MARIFVKRDNGVIIHANRWPSDDTPEELDDLDEEVVAFLNPAPTAAIDTPLKPEDIERLFRGLGVTAGEIQQAKRDRGT